MTGQPVQVGTTNTHFVYLKRKVNFSTTLVSGELKVLPATITSVIPDGAKILMVKVVGRDCRNIRVRVPKNTKLFSRGSNNDEVQDLTREVWAPLSRFPSLTVDVPDTLAQAIDTNDTSSELFTVFSSDAPGARVTLTIMFLTMV